MLFQPGCQVGWATEIEQCLSQGLQLLQRQGLDFGCGGVAQGAAAAVELTQGDCGFSERTATGLAFGLASGFAFLPASCLPLLPAPLQKVLSGAGVEQLVGGIACERPDFLGAKCWKQLKQHSENGGKQIRPALEDLLRAGRQFGLRPHRQRQQGEQGIEISLLL